MSEIIWNIITGRHWQGDTGRHTELNWEEYWDSITKPGDRPSVIYWNEADCWDCMVINLRRWAWILNRMEKQ